jgi:putative mRNA 3-end processing factor
LLDALLHLTDKGLYCAAGDFFIDPHRPVPRALITHAHADHARPGSGNYLTADAGGALLRLRVGRSATIQLARYGQTLDMGEVRVSLHPSGHLLGAAQVRIERKNGEGAGEVWVVSGDYKTDADPTCQPLEPLRCHTFLTESTFGLPHFEWPAPEQVFAEINSWWMANQNERRTSVLLAYPLGKAQRLIAGVNPAIGPIFVHPAIARMNTGYKAVGIRLPPVQQPGPRCTHAGRGRALLIAPPAAVGTAWMRKFGVTSIAMVSGWMQVRPPNAERGIEHGFVLSDHADWPGLLATVRATGAEQVLVNHGYAQEMSAWLRANGWQSHALAPQSPFAGQSTEASTVAGAGTTC